MQFQEAHRLLRALRTKRLPTHRVFDVHKLARYFAIADLMGAQQAPRDWSDMKFYYNPITGFIEPIGSEGHVMGPISTLVGSERSIGQSNFSLHNLIFSDAVFYRHYVESLEKVSQKKYLDRLLSNNEVAMNEMVCTRADKMECHALANPFFAASEPWVLHRSRALSYRVVVVSSACRAPYEDPEY